MFGIHSVIKFRLFKIIFAAFVLTGCSSTSELLYESSLDESWGIDYSIIYYIHADSDYLYHDSTGNPIRGNSLVLKTAHEVAENAKTGEVFIFYQRPERKILGLFPRRSSRFYHYENGVLTSKVEYRHSNKSEEFLTSEAQLYDQYRIQSRNDEPEKYVLYFGHEIPLEEGGGYHHTLPDIEVNIETFSKGLKHFLAGDQTRFDLVVLSTCNNGSPIMADYLMPISNTVVASPQNLHLSHIDSESLRELESSPEITSIQLARMMAEKTYNRLANEILTTITLAVYDFEEVQKYRDELREFRVSYADFNLIPLYSDNIDCKEIEIFDNERFSNGVIAWFKPARFGRASANETHSGWGCRPLIQDSSD